MLPLLAAEGIGKARGHYSGWNPAMVDEVIFIGQNPTSLASLEPRGEADAQSQSPFVQEV